MLTLIIIFGVVFVLWSIFAASRRRAPFADQQSRHDTTPHVFPPDPGISHAHPTATTHDFGWPASHTHDSGSIFGDTSNVSAGGSWGGGFDSSSSGGFDNSSSGGFDGSSSPSGSDSSPSGGGGDFGGGGAGGSW
jgi:hypothetical protein